MSNDIELKVKEIISEILAEDIEKINNTSSLRGRLNFDSMDLVEVVVGIESYYNISLNNSEFEKLKTVQDLIDIVTNKTESKVYE